MKIWKHKGKAASSLCAAALVASMVPMAALAAPTSAADVEDSTVKVSGLLTGDEVAAYLIADADISESNQLTYKFNDKVPAAYDTVEELAAVASDGAAYVEGSGMQAAAAAIAAGVTQNAPAATATADASGEASLALGSGYYLVRVTSTSGTARVYQNMVIDVSPVAGADGSYSAKPEQTVTVKSTEVKVEKGVGENYQEKTDAYQVGDTVPFKVSTAIPNYPADSVYATFSIVDTPTAGLEIDVNSIKVNDTDAGTFLAGKGAITSSESGYTIEFLKGWILANPGTSIEVTYTATLTSAAFSKSETDVTGNTAKVTFNPNPYASGTAEPDDTTTVQTYGFVFAKAAETESGTAPLEGAEFTLYDNNGNEVKDENGNVLTSTSAIVGGKAYVYFEDLKAGSYVAKETKVPAGYLAVADITFTLSGTACTSDNPATADVTENNYLVLDSDVVDTLAPNLPITGGAGTFALTAAGVVLVAGSLVLVVRGRRAEQE